MRQSIFAAAMAAATIVGVSQARADLVYVGSWDVGDGPSWSTDPLSYTGQAAAALLFGGSASDYAISTVGSDPTTVNDLAYYSVLGSGAYQLAEDYVSSNSSQAPGYYYSGDTYPDSSTDAASAYVADAANGEINYAFLVVQDVPEPASVVLMGASLIGLAALRRRA